MKALGAALVTMLGAWLLIGAGVAAFLVVMALAGWLVAMLGLGATTVVASVAANL